MGLTSYKFEWLEVFFFLLIGFFVEYFVNLLFGLALFLFRLFLLLFGLIFIVVN